MVGVSCRIVDLGRLCRPSIFPVRISGGYLSGFRLEGIAMCGRRLRRIHILRSQSSGVLVGRGGRAQRRIVVCYVSLGHSYKVVGVVHRPCGYAFWCSPSSCQVRRSSSSRTSSASHSLWLLRSS